MKNLTWFLLLGIFIAGCGNQNTEPAATMVVARQATTTTLYFNGIISPLKVTSVMAPFDGSVAQLYFDYGNVVEKKKLLLVLTSTQFNDAYQGALTNYIKAEKDYADTMTKMKGTEELDRLGIISRDEYAAAQGQVYDSSLAFAQAGRKLQALLNKSNNPANLNILNHADETKIASLLQNSNNNLSIQAPVTGITLLPTKANDAGDDAREPLQAGDQVKAGQELLSLGDISGLALTLTVNEIHINAIKVGQKAIITSEAFPATLFGEVAHVDQQATQDNGDGMPSFRVKIIVPTLSAAQRRMIHLGMSAKVALQIISPPALNVPLTAVVARDDQTWVKVVNPDSGKVILTPVITGQTSPDSVIIQRGLQAGDEIVIDAN